MDAERLERFERAEKVRDGPRESIELPDHNTIKAAPMRVRHKPVELWPLLLAARDSDVHVFRRKLPSSPLDVFPDLARLHCRVLAAVCRADSCVHRDSHVSLLRKSPLNAKFF